MQTFKEKKQDIRDKLADISCTFKGIEKAIEISTNRDDRTEQQEELLELAGYILTRTKYIGDKLQELKENN